MPSVKPFRQFVVGALNKEVDWDSDTVKVMLLSASYSPDLDAHAFKSDVAAYEITGTGYTAGGAALAGRTVTYTAANSWPRSWAASTAYEVGDIVRPTTGNGYVYVCSVAGTSGATAPTWPTTVGATVADGGATWTCMGSGVAKLSANNVTWATATFTARYGVVYIDTGTASTSRLLFLVDFDSAKSPDNGDFTIQWDTNEGVHCMVVR